MPVVFIVRNTSAVQAQPVAPPTREQTAAAEQQTGISAQPTVTPEQQRRDAGQYTKDGSTYIRQPELAPELPVGRTGKVKFADDEKPEAMVREQRIGAQ